MSNIEYDKFGHIVRKNCYENRMLVNTGDIVIASETDFDLTRNKVYVVKDCGIYITVVNDAGVLEKYSYEYFDLYQGQKVEN